ncbi:Hsp70-hsp90 organizing protein 1 [Quillaja saponaria]|uniref:Hsp70-hsp90 organizing protein 1 n=1 Tax=Quillaja saponaria TaxID=32244 RepID=A0AAD7LB20_QUISA|nr:Hsp70-hsp90 organizing protein 1 [Quillaja saponaria]
MDGTEAGSAATASPYGGRGEETSLKDKGNEFFKGGNYLKDAALYTLAIKQDSSNPTLYSNRDAAFLQLAKLNKALADTETTVTLKPQWEKLYFRKECILEAMERYDDALASFKWLCNITHRTHSVSGKYGSEESWKEMLSFLVETMETAVKSCHENSNVDARVYFLLDNEKTQTEKYAPVVNIDKAFESPHTHGSCFAFLRQYAEDSFSTAACLVARKSIIFTHRSGKDMDQGIGNMG